MSWKHTVRPGGRQAAPQWISLPCAAGWLKRSLYQSIELIKCGEIKGRLVDNKWWLHRASVRRFMKRRRGDRHQGSGAVRDQRPPVRERPDQLALHLPGDDRSPA